MQTRQVIRRKKRESDKESTKLSSPRNPLGSRQQRRYIMNSKGLSATTITNCRKSTPGRKVVHVTLHLKDDKGKTVTVKSPKGIIKKIIIGTGKRMVPLKYHVNINGKIFNILKK